MDRNKKFIQLAQGPVIVDTLIRLLERANYNNQKKCSILSHVFMIEMIKKEKVKYIE